MLDSANRESSRRRRPASSALTTAPSVLPRWLWAPAAAGALFLVLPPIAMAERVDWLHLGSLISSDSALAALSLSLRTALASTVVCLTFGLPLAIVLARTDTRGLSLVRSLVFLPLVLPPVVSGLALLYTFGQHGLVGRMLHVFGIHVAFTTLAVVIAQAFVSMPFFVISFEGTLRTFGRRYDLVAATLGARPTVVLARVTLPLALPGLLSGTALAFARSLGEFGATITFAGSLQGRTTTLPIEIYLQRVADPDAAVALAVVLVLVAVAIGVLARPKRTPS